MRGSFGLIFSGWLLRVLTVGFLIWLFFCFRSAQAETFVLANGDRITGEFLESTEAGIRVQTLALGEVLIKKEFLSASGLKQASTDKKGSGWKRSFSFGYTKTSGNTQNSRFSAGVSADRKTAAHEVNLKGGAYYSSSSNKMDSQKWDASAKYAFSFGHLGRWYNFYKFEGNHNRFTDVDYRLIPSAGIGHWFSDRPVLKAFLECGFGFERTRFRSDGGYENSMILVPRFHFEKDLIGKTKLIQDLIGYPSLENLSAFRLHSETSFVNPVDKNLSLKLSFINDYDAEPDGVAKKNDLRFVSALVYTF